MVDKNRKLLEDTIESIIQDLSTLQIGSKERTAAIEDLTKLYKLKIEETKTELEQEEKFERRIMDSTQAVEQKKDRRIKYILEAVGIGAPLVFYGIWMHKGFKFEETGSITSPVFKGLINRFRPTK